jgi:hypothetical protein
MLCVHMRTKRLSAGARRAAAAAASGSWHNHKPERVAHTHTVAARTRSPDVCDMKMFCFFFQLRRFQEMRELA